MCCEQREKCPMPKNYGDPSFNPLEAIEGYKESPIWIIALNPKTNKTDHFPNKPNPITWKNTNPQAQHFRRLKPILGEKWYQSLFKEGGVAHTDLLKCGSPAFTDTEKQAVDFCKGFLIQQIKANKPKMLLVLSSDAARLIAKAAGFRETATEGEWKYGQNSDETCLVLLSGYSSPRQERYAKLRLARDFELACKCLNLTPPQ